MIRKFGHVDAPPARVQALFVEIEAWPAWMPGVGSVAVVERTGRAVVADTDQEALGRRFRSRIEATAHETSLKLRQVSGPFRRWEATWRFRPPPDGRGTTLGLELDFELAGVLGLLNPAGLIEGRIDRLFGDVVARVRERLAATSPPAEPAAAAGEEVILRLVRTRAGLEVRFGERRIALPLRLP